MATVTLEEAQQRLGELVGELAPGNEFVIVAGGKPVATLSPPPVRPSIRDRVSVLDIQPVPAGAALRPYPHPDDDILGEMLEERMDRQFPPPGAMIGLDTSFLVRLALAETPRHLEARRLLEQEVGLAGGRLALVPLVISEFMHVVTDPRRFVRPLTMDETLAQAAQWWNASEVTRINPSEEAGLLFFEWMARHRLGRKRILDTLLAATLHTAGVRRLFTTNPDNFRVFGVFELLVP